MFVRRSSLLAFGLSLLCTMTTASAWDIDPATDLDPATHWLVLGDFNGDGLVDGLYQPMDGNSDGGILVQDANGNLSILAQGWTPGYLGLDWSSEDTTLNVADLNGDGLGDVIAQPVQPGGDTSILFLDPTTHQLLQIGQVIPANYLGFDWSSSAHTVVAADFDGDHHAEVFMQQVNPGDTGYVVHTDATGQLAAITQTIPDGYLGRSWNSTSITLYAGDFNGDGRQDLLIQVNPGISLAESAYALLLADANGQFTGITQTWNLNDLGGEWDPTTHQVVIEDANHDGKADITLRSIDPNGNNYVYLGNAQGVFTQPAATWVGDVSASDTLNPPQSGRLTSYTTSTLIGFGGDQFGSRTVVGANPIPEPTDPPTIPNPGAPGSSPAPGATTIVPAVALGSMSGKGGVSGGTASYSVPVAIPPGIAGMQPAVSFNYSSRGGNGEMGMGWSLSAGSQIHRCPATQAMDGYSVGVTYGPKDHLCLDGQHLILVPNTAAYGATGAQYRTELDSFALITETGNINGTGSASSYFTVQHKDGRTTTYGHTSDSAFIASGVTDPLAWGISKDVDAHGNTVQYSYISHASNSALGLGEYLLSDIYYTGFGTTAGNRNVHFTYQPRQDVTSQYLAGGVTTQTQLLSTVYSSANGAVGAAYQLEYRGSGATHRSLLTGIQECAGVGVNRACLPETKFTWQNPATSYATPINLGEDLDANTKAFAIYQANQVVVSGPGDLDGDGRKEVMYSKPGSYTRFYFLNSDGSTKAMSDVTSLVGSGVVMLADVNNDGAEDMLSSVSGTGGATWLGYRTFTGFAPNGAGGQTATFSAIHNLQIPYSATLGGVNTRLIIDVKDADGDGLPDVISMGPDPQYTHYVMQVRKNVTPAGAAVPQFADPVTISPYAGEFAGDVDGNGLPDYSVSVGTQLLGYVFTIRNANGSLSYPYYSTSQLGIDNMAVDTRNFHLQMDINGDGLRDFVYDCWNSSAQGMDLCYQLNTGVPGSAMFGTPVDTQRLDPLDENEQAGVFQADLDGDGVDELVYPYTLLSEYCIYQQGVKTADGKVTAETCAYHGDYGKTLAPSDDFSIYSYHRMKFQPNADSSQPSGYRYVPVGGSTGIIAQSHLATAMDVQGDGLVDVVSPFTSWYQFGHFRRAVDAPTSYQRPAGPSIASSTHSSLTGVNAAPDMMLTATDGFGLKSAWTYYPLSAGTCHGDIASPCDSSFSGVSFNNVPLYYVPSIGDSGRYSNSDYFYFASSMYVVGTYTVKNKSGSGVAYVNDHYHYNQAIYNNQGRGFQGFRTVVEDDMLTGARTVERYHQRFPLSGELQDSWVKPQASSFDLSRPEADIGNDVTHPVDSSIVSYTQDSWGCMIGSTAAALTVDNIPCDQVLGPRTFLPVLAESVQESFDINSHDLLATTDTVYCPVSGLGCNGSKPGVGAAAWSEGYDNFGNSLGSVTTVTDTYGDANETHHGVYTSSVSDVYDTSDTADWWIDKLLSRTTSVDASYDGADQGVRTRKSTYDSYSERLPTQVTALANDTSMSVITTTAYTRGNVTDVVVKPGTSVPAAASFDPRETLTSYSTGGDANYFPIKVTDPLGHVTQMTTDPVLGVVKTVTDMNNIVTTNGYDVFGRKISSSTLAPGASNPITQTFTYTAPDGSCPSSDGAGSNQYYVVVNTDGAPTHYTCYDELNRVMRTGGDSFDGGDTVVQDTQYNARGHVTQTSEPYFLSAGAPLWNVNGYDSDLLGRQNALTNAKGVLTQYSHADLATIITTTADGQVRKDEEIKNSLGKLMQVQNVTNVTTGQGRGAKTLYGYDSDGNPTTITAVNGLAATDPSSTIVATYDILGHKTKVQDPDQGETDYTYDLLGELLTQTDANHVVTQMTYDDGGRMHTKQSPDGYTTWCYDGTGFSGTPGTCSGSATVGSIGKLTVVTRDTGLAFQESYAYDGWGRVILDRQTLDNNSYDTTTAYDGDGRISNVTYPSSVVDAAPTVNAGSTTYVAPGAHVTLNGTATDSDGGPQLLNYQWTQTGGTAVTLSGSATLSPSFTVGSSPNKTYSFALKADDGLLATTGTVSVVVPALPTIGTPQTDGDSDHNGAYNVSWTSAAVPGTTSMFDIQEAKGTDAVTPPADSAYVDLTPSGTSNTSYPASHPGNGSYYYWYRVNGTDMSGTSDWSTPVAIHVVVKPGAPASISPAGGTGIIGQVYTISWGAYSGALPASKVFYELYESTSSTFTSQTLAYTGANRSQGIAKSTGQAGTYYYRVRACNQNDGVKACSPYTSGASVTVISGGGGGGGTGCPPPPEQCQLVMSEYHAGLAVLSPSEGMRSTLPSVEFHPQDPAAPRYAPPVYKAWKHARLRTASTGGTTAQLSVNYHYSSTGYLQSMSDAVDDSRVFWIANALNARGQVTDENYGPDGAGAVLLHVTHDYDAAAGFQKSMQINQGALPQQSAVYTWSSLGNLKHRTAQVLNGSTLQTLDEDFTYDLHNRLLSAQVTNANGLQPKVTYAYDPNGNITCKSDVISHDCSVDPTGYVYGENGAGPHAVTHIGAAAYGYDLAGNMLNRKGTTVAWNADDMPTSIDQHDGNNSAFNYTPDKRRYKQVSNSTTDGAHTVYYIGGLEADTKGTGSTAVTTFTHMLTAYGRTVVTASFSLNSTSQPTLDARYVVGDQVNSFSFLIEAKLGNNVSQSFDAFGASRSGTDWHTPVATIAPRHRGFTGHEHLDSLALIHMNGRLYDPTVGRMMSVDPYYQSPTNTQSINPYSYVMNNPLSLTDPSGYEAACPDGSSTACPNIVKSTDDPSKLKAGLNTVVGPDGKSTTVYVASAGEQVTVTHPDGSSANVTAGGAGVTVNGQAQNGASMTMGSSDAQHQPGGSSDIGSPKTAVKLNDNLNVKWSDGDSGNSQSAELDGFTSSYKGKSWNFWSQNPNPTPEEYQEELGILSDATGVPERALNALYGTESNRTQFSGNRPLTSNTGAVGISQILPHTAQSYGIDFARAGTDWQYNMEAGAAIYMAGYDHKWNNPSPNDRFHAIRGYDFYHDGFEAYRHNFGISGSGPERNYMDEYDGKN